MLQVHHKTPQLQTVSYLLQHSECPPQPGQAILHGDLEAMEEWIQAGDKSHRKTAASALLAKVLQARSKCSAFKQNALGPTPPSGTPLTGSSCSHMEARQSINGVDLFTTLRCNDAPKTSSTMLFSIAHLASKCSRVLYSSPFGTYHQTSAPQLWWRINAVISACYPTT